MRKMTRIGFVAMKLETIVLLDRRGIGQVERMPSCYKPSTSQYQLYVDSTTTPNSSCRYGLRATQMVARSLSNRFEYTT
ncbi:hypothetical protein, partial [Pseudoduganella sp. RAF53_2]|uniref:hypothetical protein n=1 Tax=Pseudoduganella sp. RAF53_2 TaxID=3233060 RepID=UPI003F9E0DED